jgi:hypothetical protein
MRRSLFVAGALVIVVGLAVVAYTQLTVQTVPIPEDPSGEVVSGFHVVSVAHVTVRWSGGLSTTVVHMFSCSDPTCANPTDEIGNGTGAAGSFVVPVDASHSYELNTTGGPPVNGSLTISGLTNLTLIGVTLMATGGVLAGWSWRGRRVRVTERPETSQDPPDDVA